MGGKRDTCRHGKGLQALAIGWPYALARGGEEAIQDSRCISERPLAHVFEGTARSQLHYELVQATAALFGTSPDAIRMSAAGW